MNTRPRSRQKTAIPRAGSAKPRDREVSRVACPENASDGKRKDKQMRISEEQVRIAIESHKARISGQPAGTIYEKQFQPSEEAGLITTIRDEVMAMPEVREELVARIKAAVEAGEYHVSAEDIVDAIIRRDLADRVR